MELIWERIKYWMNKNAPQLINLLNTGISDASLIEFEVKLQEKIPEDFKKFYKIHNGQDRDGEYLVDGEELLSIERILEEWNVWKGILDSNGFQENGVQYTSEPEKGIKNDWWNNKWIPITYDGGGNHICIDLDPTEDGKRGQIIRMWHDSPERELIANSFKEWIGNYSENLNSGKYIYSEYDGGIINKDELS